MARLTLVTGGCRSGKSRFALNEASRHEGHRTFIATCPRIAHIDGGEMDRRILKHQEERRGAHWETLEEELELSHLLRGLRGSVERVVVLDCLTLWTNNLIYHAGKQSKTITESEVRQKSLELVEAATGFPGHVYWVTGEVGLGLVPENRESRHFRDLLGTCNRSMAEQASDVFFMVSGIPLKIK